MGVDQILMVKPTPDGRSGLPPRCAPPDDRTFPLGVASSARCRSPARRRGRARRHVPGRAAARPARRRRRRLGPRLRGRRGRGVPRLRGRPATGSSAVSRSCSPSCGASGWRSTSRLRSRGHGEDPRYVELLAKAPGNPQLFALRRIYLTQGVVMWFVSLPVQVAMFDAGRGQPRPPGSACCSGLVGFIFETVGDLQLTRFRNDPATQGQVLDTGLWRYTRHPNYFGDACVWWGLSLDRVQRLAGRAHDPLAAADDLAARQGHRQAAAREGHGVAPARLRRLRPPYQRVLPAAAEAGRPRRLTKG